MSLAKWGTLTSFSKGRMRGAGESEVAKVALLEVVVLEMLLVSFSVDFRGAYGCTWNVGKSW